MYVQLQKCLGPFATEEITEESLYPFKTNLNEAANHAVSRTRPQFKLLDTSMTLKTRVCKVVSTQDMGYKNYINAVLKALHVNQLDLQQHYFDKAIIQMDQTKIKIIANNKRGSTSGSGSIRSKPQNKNKFLLRELKKIGTYGSGLAFEKKDETENEERRTN